MWYKRGSIPEKKTIKNQTDHPHCLTIKQMLLRPVGQFSVIKQDPQPQIGNYNVRTS